MNVRERSESGGTWKEKILDYEIETGAVFLAREDQRYTWKEKILDYEIETRLRRWDPLAKRTARTWKEKILDYEIET